MQLLFKLFVSFALIGLIAYGGGLVAIPLIQHEIVGNRQWLNINEMTEIVAIAQMTPGPIAINAATLTGFHVAGVAGSVVATLAVLLPSILILVMITPFIERAGENKLILKLRQGTQLGVLSLIFFAVWSYGLAVVTDWRDLAIVVVSFLFLVAFEGKLHPVIVVLACGAAGLIIF
jgi:chromate transporter